ncbi:MAG TPA: serine--tRNA ligase [archaeon]|nr:serine--tRNA ligase [archaeon]
MLDIRFIREKPELVRKDLEKRGDPQKLEQLRKLIEIDRKWRENLQSLESLRRERNELTERIASLKRSGKDASRELEKVKGVPKKIKELEGTNEALKKETDFHLMRLPNILHHSVPVGKDETENVEVKKWGKVPHFSFRPRNHAEIAESLGLLDFERAAKVAGHGFAYLKGSLAMLDQAILRLAIDHLVGKGYTLVEPPLMLQRKPYEGVTDLADFENVMYKIEGDDLYLIATSEHPMAAMHMDEILEAKELPIKLVGVSPCFRREVGAHGKYTRGLFRMHQFNKVEQFIFSLPEDSWKLHEELQRNSEELYKGLGLAYRVVNVCTGDIGIIAAKKYDTEVWMADGEYREIGSNSNCTDYQARRLNVRYREKEGVAPAGFVHTLNNTALATSRTMVAILEQYQNKDGTVDIPEILRPYMGGMKKLEKLK